MELFVMGKKLKHTKIKNTGILYELLTRQITVDVLNGVDSKAIKIVKESFNQNTSLGKELQLYKLLTEKRAQTESKANTILEIVLNSRKRISNSKIRTEKYNLIKKINEAYNATDFFNGRIPNYRLLASIYNIFQSETTDEKFKADQLVNSKFTVLEHITHKKIDDEKIKQKVIAEYSKQDKDLRLLAYEILVDKFNKKYKSLDESQKKLLKNYINNISNTNSLREYVDKEVTRIKSVLKKELPRVDDKITSIKLTEAINQIENLTKGKIVNEKQVLSLMRYYELIKEIKNVHKG